MTYQEISNEIIKTFESQLWTLGSKYQSHWCVRRYRQTKDVKYLQPILIDYQLRTLRMFPWLKQLDDKDFIESTDQDLRSRFKGDTPKKARRLVTYNAHTPLLFYTLFIQYLFFTKNLGMDKNQTISPYFDRAINHLKNIDLKSLYLNDDFARSHPSAVANTTGYLDYLGIGNYWDETESLIKKVWLDQHLKEDLDFSLSIYAMTHIVIAMSDYYQHSVDPQKVQWILDYFEKNIDEILNRASADIIAEVGMSFVLTQTESEALTKAKDFIVKAFDPNLGYVPRDNGEMDLGKAEHRNVLAMMLLSGTTEWNSGPSLHEYILQGKSFYIPQEVEIVGKSEYEVD